MNLESYFERIGYNGPSDKADLETLKNLHRQHVLSIPFENLSIHCGEWITTDLESIYTKIVKNNRGGWCFENNQLFSWVLKEMGYTNTTLGARVFNRDKKEFYPDESHLINKVLINGKSYIADVSFGVSNQLWHPIELVSGKDQPQLPGVFRIVEKSGVWILEKTGRKPLIPNESFANSSLINKTLTSQIYSFALKPRDIDHFQETSKLLQTSPESLFTNKSICSLQTPSGFKALIGWTYSEVTYNYQDGIDLLDMKDIANDEIDKVLKEEFSLSLKSKHTPKNTKVCYTL
ncbi:arylamine N-acetyltransferase, pineal gland isozyme NAT-10-like [Conger conger]|uniref:arylamine N-acetyltransferase, pineal gland isozyme NAT-10-like n=1 Tax=Conger conger TaxID=82655 RepID=UPI002A5B0A44|nr:arylamine N-acetyltransferase, pineal gland isozyme NAT-10-like [Conger conger]XP_061078238.1 arylamine N-acetyltransferase, pineal gland isozyme NAT-10-like [Conger conger]